MTLPINQQIKDRYLIRRSISMQGGFGNTYLAYDAIRKQDVVIKESKTSGDIEQEALLSELQLLKSLEHPRLPRVYDGFFYGGQLCVTMQYIPGRDVSSYLVIAAPDQRADPPDRPTALRWICQTLEALAYLHNHGIVHRDVKPANLRVHHESGDIFLLDFGISQQTDRNAIRAHSPHFSPPEQYEASGVTTPASDVYAVGATLYLLLTGRRPPFRDDLHGTTMRLPTEENQTIPIELENVVLKAMSLDPAERFADAQAMLDALIKLGYAVRRPENTTPAQGFSDTDAKAATADAASTSARTTPSPIGSTEAAGEPGPAELPGEANTGERFEDRKKRTWLIVASGLGLLLIGITLVLGMLFLLRPSRPVVAEVSSSVPTVPTFALPVSPTLPPEEAVRSTIETGITSEATVIPSAEPITAVVVITRTISPTPLSSATPYPSITPVPYVVQRIDVADQPDSAFVYVGKLPLRLTLLGEQLTGVRTVTLQPRTPVENQPAVGLTLLRVEMGRVDLTLDNLPRGYRNGQYELLLNGQPISNVLTLRDYLRESRILGIKDQYRYLAAIRPLPSYRFKGEEIPGPFGVLYLRPDESARGGYLRNGDRLEILDVSSHPGWYRVRVKENFDPGLVGYEGWVLAWIVDDTPPPPPEPGAIQVPWNIRGESIELVIETLLQRGVPRERIVIDPQTRERIPEVFDTFKQDQVVSSEPPSGAWLLPGSSIVLGVRAP